MNETEWLAGKDPAEMLGFIDETASDRKLRLITCAIVRHPPYAANGRTIWELLPDWIWFGSPTLNCRTVVEAAERYADGHETAQSWDLIVKFAGPLGWFAEADTFLEDSEELDNFAENSGPGNSRLYEGMALAVESTVHEYGKIRLQPLRRRTRSMMNYLSCARDSKGLKLHSKHERRVCDLIREIVGNPFRPPDLDQDWLMSPGQDALKLARSIDDRRAFDELPLLASALEAAGFGDPEIVAHCRSPNRHVKGCWALEALLGKP